MQYEEGCICSTRRRLCSAKRECTVFCRSASSPVGGQGVWSKKKVCIINEGRKCAVPLLSHLQHKDKVVQCAVPELLHQQ